MTIQLYGEVTGVDSSQHRLANVRVTVRFKETERCEGVLDGSVTFLINRNHAKDWPVGSIVNLTAWSSQPTVYIKEKAT